MKVRKIAAFLLTGMIMASASPSALQAEETPVVASGSEAEQASVSLTKKLQMAEGITVPDVTFDFEITANTANAPQASVESISYNADTTKGNLTDGKYILSQDKAITFGTFTKTGVYEYTVKETTGQAEGVVYSTEEYTLRVYVANKTDGGFYIKSVTAEKDGEKQDAISFTNTYTQNANLVIEKNTVGDLADKEKDFTFKIQFIKAATEAETVDSYTGTIGNENVVCNIGQAAEFKLHDGEQLVFQNIPAGTRYIVTEVGEEDGYTPAVQVTENGVQRTAANGNDGGDISSVQDGESSNLAGENENKVSFTNTYNEVPLTGLIMNNKPVFILCGIAFVGLILLTAFKRRKNYR